MQARTGRQSRRIEKRRDEHSQMAEPTATRDAGESISADEQRRARLAMAVLGLAFGAMGLTYVVLAAGAIFG